MLELLLQNYNSLNIVCIIWLSWKKQRRV